MLKIDWIVDIFLQGIFLGKKWIHSFQIKNFFKSAKNEEIVLYFW